MLVVTSQRPDGWVAVRLGGRPDGPAPQILQRAVRAHLWSRPRGYAFELRRLRDAPDPLVVALAAAVLEVAESGCWVDVACDELVQHRRLAADPVLANVLAPYRRHRAGERVLARTA